IRKMDGRLLLESEPGRGSCFTVVLEHVRYEEGAPEQAGAVSGKEKASMVFARPLLLVDDVPMNLKVLEAMLRKLDVPYLACASGAEALELAAKELPCVILTDLWMPGMNGGELAERLAGDPVLREIPVIAVTADSQIDPKLEGLFDGVLLKPISLDGLRKLLNGLPVKRTAIDC
ncbi:MAG: response regulator, partial [Victivallis vadensis]